MIAFIADIHGNYPALFAVFEDLKRYKITQIYSLGDVAGYYPLVNECIELLRDSNVINILGNHDNYLVNDIKCERSSKVNLAIEYQRKIITKENLAWLKNSPSSIETNDFFAVHGGFNDYLEEYSDDSIIEKYEFPRRIFLCGHTHIAKYARRWDKTFCNPGSVGQPRDKKSSASYALYSDDTGLYHKRVNYDIPYIVQATKDAGFSSDFYEGLYTGEPIGAKGK